MSRRQKIKSANWRRAQDKDWHVKQSRQSGYRSRAAYKLIEINAQFNITKGCRCVIDLGAAPGSWSQVLAKLLPVGSRLVAVDLLKMPSIAGVDFIQGDFLAEATWNEILQKISPPIDLIVSDMAPNLTGITAVDSENVFNLNQEVIEFATQHLSPTGQLVFKSFDNQYMAKLRQRLLQQFSSVRQFRPQATRSASSELFFLCQGRKVNANHK